jgi:ribosome-binding protein aMBF1 (putative translation factor)
MTTTFKQLKAKALKNSAVKAEYDAFVPEYTVIKSIIANRQKRGLSQQQLAERVGTRQPVISRLERGGGNPTLNLLQRVANALDLKLEVSLR